MTTETSNTATTWTITRVWTPPLRVTWRERWFGMLTAMRAWRTVLRPGTLEATEYRVVAQVLRGKWRRVRDGSTEARRVS